MDGCRRCSACRPTGYRGRVSDLAAAVERFDADDPGFVADLTSGAVDPAVAGEELLRWDSPLQLFERWVLEPGVEIAGQELAVGDEIAMLFGSGQRDPRRFDDPDTFDVGRNEPAHLGFGGGIHFCVGAPLARQELMHSVAGIVERFPDLALAAEPTYHPTFVIRGLTGLQLNTGVA